MQSRLKLISWIGAVFTVVGTLLNAYQIIWCWPIWMIGNCIWLYWSYSKKEWAQFFLFSAFQLSNTIGWYQWSIMM